MWINFSEEDLALLQKGLHGEHGLVTTTERMQMQALAATITDRVAEQRTPEAQQYRDGLPYLSEGDWDVDGDAIVSAGADEGAYVMVWRWVSNDDAGIKEESDDEQAA